MALATGGGCAHRGASASHINPNAASRRQRFHIAFRFAPALLAGAVSLALQHWPGEATAQTTQAAEQQFDIDVPVQPLGQALAALSRQTGVQVFAAGELVSGRTAPAVTGRLSARQALGRLLVGSGLQARQDGSVLTVERVAASATPSQADVTLPDVKVVGSASRPAGGSPELTSPVARTGVLGDRPVLDIPFSVQSFTRELIEAQQARSVRDVLINDASVQTQTTASSYNHIFTIRGFDPGNYYFDGLTGPIGNQVDFPLELVESVDVLRGPSSVLFGGGGLQGIGGAVNFVPKRAPMSGSIRSITFGYQTQSVGRATIDLGGRFGEEGRLGYRLNAGHEQGERVAEDNKITNSFIGGSLEWRAAPGLKFTADAGVVRNRNRAYQDTLFLPPSVPLPPAPDPTKNFALRYSSYETNIDYGLLKTEWQIGQGWHLDAAYLWASSAQPYAGAGCCDLIDEQGNAEVFGPLYADGSTRKRSAKLTLRGKFQTAFLAHDLVLNARRDDENVEAQFGRYDLSAFGGTIFQNIFNPITYWVAPPRLPPAGVFRVDTKITTLQALDFISLTPQWTVLAGLGHVSIKDAIAEYDESKVTPLLGLIYKPSANTSLYVGYAEGLEQGGTAPLTADNNPRGQRLPPKVGKQIELGIKTELDGLALSAALFDLDRALEFVDASNIFVQSGRQNHKGLELAASGQVGSRLSVLTTALFLRPTVDDGSGMTRGNKPAGVPSAALRVFGSYSLASLPGLSLNAALTYRSSQQLDLENTGSVPSWAVWDLGASYSLRPGFNSDAVLRFAVENVTDRRYYNGVSFGGRSLAVGEARAAKASVTVNF